MVIRHILREDNRGGPLAVGDWCSTLSPDAGVDCDKDDIGSCVRTLIRSP
jgi:hypothetical protein